MQRFWRDVGQGAIEDALGVGNGVPTGDAVTLLRAGHALVEALTVLLETGRFATLAPGFVHHRFMFLFVVRRRRGGVDGGGDGICAHGSGEERCAMHPEDKTKIFDQTVEAGEYGILWEQKLPT